MQLSDEAIFSSTTNPALVDSHCTTLELGVNYWILIVASNSKNNYQENSL